MRISTSPTQRTVAHKAPRGRPRSVNEELAQLAEYKNAPFAYLNPAIYDAPGTADPGTTTGAPTGGTRTCFGDASGIKTPLAPDFAGSLGVTYTLPSGDDSELRLSLLGSYNSGYVFESDGVFDQGEYALLNASAEYRFNPNWGIEVWANNLTDTAYYVQKLTGTHGTTSALAAPQTYGVNLKFNY